MLKTWQFWVTCVTFFLGAGIGLTTIGEAAPMIKELGATGAVLSAGAALGVMALFNGLGRLAWGSVSDRTGRTQALVAMCALYLAVCALIMPNAASFWPVLASICLIGFCYGGFLAIMPSLTADYYGARNIGANYGILFSAWGAAGFLIPGYFAGIIEAAKNAGRLAEGYHDVFYRLAALAVLAGAAAMLSRRPVAE